MDIISILVDNFAVIFAKKFPELVDHFENDKPIFTLHGTLLFCFGSIEYVRGFLKILSEVKNDADKDKK